jgi:hypothetical protein
MPHNSIMVFIIELDHQVLKLEEEFIPKNALVVKSANYSIGIL